MPGRQDSLHPWGNSTHRSCVCCVRIWGRVRAWETLDDRPSGIDEQSADIRLPRGRLTSQIQPMTVAKAEFLLAMWNLIPADGPVQRDLPSVGSYRKAVTGHGTRRRTGRTPVGRDEREENRQDGLPTGSRKRCESQTDPSSKGHGCPNYAHPVLMYLERIYAKLGSSGFQLGCSRFGTGGRRMQTHPTTTAAGLPIWWVRSTRQRVIYHDSQADIFVVAAKIGRGRKLKDYVYIVSSDLRRRCRTSEPQATSQI